MAVSKHKAISMSPETQGRLEELSEILQVNQSKIVASLIFLPTEEIRAQVKKAESVLKGHKSERSQAKKKFLEKVSKLSEADIDKLLKGKNAH